METISVIIVEDEFIAAEFLKEMLQEQGVEVLDIIDNGKEAIEVCIAKKPDVIFMDVMLRDNISGSEAAVTISQAIQTKIIFLTAYVDTEMVDYAVASHAAAYLTKPYNEAQIIATLRLVTASDETVAKERDSDKVYLKGGYVYIKEYKRLLKDNKEVELGPKALKLIDLLASQPNISMSHEQISIHVWGEPVNDKTLRSLLFRIRQATNDAFIKNVSGTGYMVETQDG